MFRWTLPNCSVFVALLYTRSRVHDIYQIQIMFEFLHWCLSRPFSSSRHRSILLGDFMHGLCSDHLSVGSILYYAISLPPIRRHLLAANILLRMARCTFVCAKLICAMKSPSKRPVQQCGLSQAGRALYLVRLDAAADQSLRRKGWIFSMASRTNTRRISIAVSLRTTIREPEAADPKMPWNKVSINSA
jgi:hypothetical protein